MRRMWHKALTISLKNVCAHNFRFYEGEMNFYDWIFAHWTNYHTSPIAPAHIHTHAFSVDRVFPRFRYFVDSQLRLWCQIQVTDYKEYNRLGITPNISFAACITFCRPILDTFCIIYSSGVFTIPTPTHSHPLLAWN